jgi:uncharacterized protein YjaZ
MPRLRKQIRKPQRKRSEVMIHVHLLDASNRLQQYRNKLLEIGHKTVARVQEMMPIEQVNVVLCFNPLGVSAETGIGGFAPSNDTVFVYLNPNTPSFTASLEHQFPAAIAHELHHAMRWHNPGYGQTLIEAFVSEGLAQAFEIPFLGHELPVLSQLKEPQGLNELMELARLEYHHDLSIYHEWFGGFNARNIPRNAGYAIGFEIVKQYLEKADTTAGEVYAVTAKEILETLNA